MARVLLIAPANGQDIGELWVGFQWARNLAPLHDVTLLSYRKRGASPVAGQLSGLRVIEWVEPAGFGRFERFNSLLKPGYLSFYMQARRWIRAALAAGERFDVAHQPVPVAIRYPSPVAGLGIPYIVGPVGGSLDSPAGFVADEGGEPWYVRLRKIDDLRLRHDPLLRRTYEDASCVVGIAPYVRDELGSVSVRRFETMSETGLVTLPDAPTRDYLAPTEGRPLRLLFVGRVIRTKGVRDVVAAMGRLADLPIELDVVGDGFDRGACESLAARLGVSASINFVGRLPRDAVDDYYRRADIFVFPSYREPGGNAVFEAMGFALPLVVCDRGGPASAVDESCAELLTAIDPDQYAQSIADSVRRLALDPDRRRRMGLAARSRVQNVGLWSSKIEAMSALYATLCDGPAEQKNE